MAAAVPVTVDAVAGGAVIDRSHALLRGALSLTLVAALSDAALATQA